MKDLKIRVADEAESKEAQGLFFELGYYWAYKNLGKKLLLSKNDVYLFAESDGTLGTGTKEDESFFNDWHGREVTLQELRDMVNPMKEYLEKQADGSYKLVMRGIVGRDDDIEVPEGENVAYKDHDSGAVYFTSIEMGYRDVDVIWQRHVQPEELPFVDDEPKEYLREGGNGSYILELTCKQEATEPHAKHWIEVPVGVNFYYSFASGDKVFTKEHSSLGRLLWQRKTYFSINDQYAEIEQVRKQTIEATLAERQAQYGCFEDVARTTGKIMEALSEVRVNGLNDLPYPHRMALYMIASKMARIVNGDFNHKDGWHDIGGYSKLIEDLL